MSNLKTLKEVCAALDVSRRAVQGYEEVGLVKATKKNRYGHLLYDEKAQDRIEQIKFFQDIGLSIKEIAALIDAPREILKPALERRIENLEAEIAKKKLAIKKANELLKELED